MQQGLEPWDFLDVDQVTKWDAKVRFCECKSQIV